MNKPKDTTKTTITMIYHKDNICIAVHICDGAPLEYVLQAAGDTYNCWARHFVITEKDSLVVISVDSATPKITTVNCQHRPLGIAELLKKCTENPPESLDVLMVNHSNFNIINYEMYTISQHVGEYKNILQLVSTMADHVHNLPVQHMKSIIWEKIRSEQL